MTGMKPLSTDQRLNELYHKACQDTAKSLIGKLIKRKPEGFNINVEGTLMIVAIEAPKTIFDGYWSISVLSDKVYVIDYQTFALFFDEWDVISL